jgi:hypothetical protein
MAVRLLSGDTVQMKCKKYPVEISKELRVRLDDLLGETSHRLLVAPPKMKPPSAPRRGPSRAD